MIPDMKIGYARVSTDDQNLDLQKDALTRAGCERIHEEHKSGKNLQRPELALCRSVLRAGDVLVVWRLDRLGRSLADLIRIVTELREANIGFESVTEKIDTTTATGELTFEQIAERFSVHRSTIYAALEN